MFSMLPNAVDPELVPVRQLSNGVRIPAIGLGTFGSDKYGSAEIADAVRGALSSGYRLIDCAACYGNEDAIGAVFAQALASGLNRSELFVISKVWNDRHKPAELIASCKKSLRDLRLDYLDAYLIHWPFPNSENE